LLGVDLWSSKTLKALVLPGGAILLAADVVFREAFGPIPAPIIHFCFYAVSAAGIFLAWRFHSSRILFALLTLLLAHRALEFFSAGHLAASGPGSIALEAIAFLLPLNFIAFSLFPERGLALPAIFSRLAVLFFESVFVAIICRPGETAGPGFLHPDFLSHLSWTRIPTLALLAFGASLVVLLLRFLLYGKPTESGLLWALVATFVSFQTGAVGSVATAYLAAASLILVTSIIENSYMLAYHDELTALPARRAFNDALFRLEEPYVVAAVDIDHFKRFNDAYGHETGDQVLRMVAAKLADATGGGQAYRVGGEEFTILFPGKTAKDVLPHLELLRSVIEVSSFRVRAGQDRRGPKLRSAMPNGESSAKEPAGQDRRGMSDRRSHPPVAPALRKRTRIRAEAGSNDLSVTVSIGVATPSARARTVEEVVQAADKALYRAKQAGRNRVESAHQPRPARQKLNIA
jgi:diguanylate cyclase (GGDEF)-like protein